MANCESNPTNTNYARISTNLTYIIDTLSDAKLTYTILNNGLISVIYRETTAGDSILTVTFNAKVKGKLYKSLLL